METGANISRSWYFHDPTLSSWCVRIALGKWCPWTLVCVCLTAASHDQTKGHLPWLNKKQKKKKKRIGLKQKHGNYKGDDNQFALTSMQVQEQSNVAISRLVNFIVLRRNMAGRNSFIYLVQEDIVWVKSPFSFERCQHNKAQATSILKTPAH